MECRRVRRSPGHLEPRWDVRFGIWGLCSPSPTLESSAVLSVGLCRSVNRLFPVHEIGRENIFRNLPGSWTLLWYFIACITVLVCDIVKSKKTQNWLFTKIVWEALLNSIFRSVLDIVKSNQFWSYFIFVFIPYIHTCLRLLDPSFEMILI